MAIVKQRTPSVSQQTAQWRTAAIQYNKAARRNISIGLGNVNTNLDWDGENNPNIQKWQSQQDDKAANFLAKVDKTTNLAQYDDGYAYYDNPMQKFVLEMGLNGKPTVMSAKEFDSYVAATGQKKIYRGWSSQSSIDRFINATHNHTGTGIYGDGIYFTTTKSTASGYSNGRGGNLVTTMALSPTARVVERSDVLAAINKASPKLQKALRYAGSKGARSYSPNDGEAQMAAKMGANVIHVSGDYYYAIDRSAFVIRK